MAQGATFHALLHAYLPQSWSMQLYLKAQGVYMIVAVFLLSSLPFASVDEDFSSVHNRGQDVVGETFKEFESDI